MNKPDNIAPHAEEPGFWLEISMEFLRAYMREYILGIIIPYRSIKDALASTDPSRIAIDRLHSPTIRVCRLLSGYSIETMIKACLAIAYGSEVWTEDNTRRIYPFATHDPEVLWKSLKKKWNIPIPASFISYFQRIDEDLRWKAKYPVPKKNAPKSFEIGYSGADHRQVKEIWLFFWNILSSRDRHSTGLAKASLYQDNSTQSLDPFEHVFYIVHLETFKARDYIKESMK